MSLLPPNMVYSIKFELTDELLPCFMSTVFEFPVIEDAVLPLSPCILLPAVPLCVIETSLVFPA